MAHDLHAGDTETSAMLAARPDLVNMDLAKNFQTKMQEWEAARHLTGLTGQPARPGWTIDDLNDEGALGNATAATANAVCPLSRTAGCLALPRPRGATCAWSSHP